MPGRGHVRCLPLGRRRCARPRSTVATSPGRRPRGSSDDIHGRFQQRPRETLFRPELSFLSTSYVGNVFPNKIIIVNE